jgi:type IV pilus secretin PilQ/predicted competence protein
MRRDWFARIVAILAVASITPVALPVSAETGSAAPASADGVTSPTEGGSATPAAPAAPPRASTSVTYRGDDALPTAREANNNPYVGTESLTGDFAFVPPTPLDEPEEKIGTGEDLRRVLGAEVYDRRINVVTPPNTDVEEVIRLLSEKAELNFLYSSGVIKGQVTLNLNNVKLGVALNSLLGTQQLSIVREGDNVMRIAPRVEVKGSAVELRTIYIKLNWVLADQLEGPLLSAMKGSGGGEAFTRIVSQKETNTLIVTDTPGNVTLIRDLVGQLDVPEKQVMIEARLVEFTTSRGRNTDSTLRIDDRNLDAAGGTQLLPGIVPLSNSLGNGAQLRSIRVGDDGGTFGFGGIVGIFGREFDVEASLTALESQRMATILQNPRVITLNNQPAEIEILQDNPYFEAQQGVTEGSISVTVKFQESGVTLKVTPTITNTGFVRLRVEPQQKLIIGRTAPDEVNIEGVPIVASRRALTNVIVKDEDTVVLGGLRGMDSAMTISQVPWLGEVSVLGHLFKGRNKNELKSDLSVFVTPKVIKAPVMSPAENYQYSRLDAHWDLPDYFFEESMAQREQGSPVLRDSENYEIPSLNLPDVR